MSEYQANIEKKDKMSFLLRIQNMSKNKLLDQVREQIGIKHYSLQTEKSYIGWIKHYIFYHENKKRGQDIKYINIFGTVQNFVSASNSS